MAKENKNPEVLRTYSAERARQGVIILRARWQKIIFFGGLAACVLLLFILRIAAH